MRGGPSGPGPGSNPMMLMMQKGMMSGPSMMGSPQGGSGKMGMPPIAYPGMRPGAFPPGGPDGKENPAANQTDDNLIEVTVYGIAVLYRRPDPPKTTEQPAVPGQPQPGVSVPPSGSPEPTASPAGQQPSQTTSPPSGTPQPAPQPAAGTADQQPAQATPPPATGGKR